MQVKYLRDKNGKPYATFWTDGEKFGWSLCSKEDKFVKKVGVALAEMRAQPFSAYWVKKIVPPQSIRNQFYDWVVAERKYYTKRNEQKNEDGYEMRFENYYSDNPGYYLIKNKKVIAQFSDQESIMDVYEYIMGKGPMEWILEV